MGDGEDTPLEDMADDDDDAGGDEGRGRGKDGRWRLGMGIITEKGRNQTLVNPWEHWGSADGISDQVSLRPLSAFFRHFLTYDLSEWAHLERPVVCSNIQR